MSNTINRRDFIKYLSALGLSSQLGPLTSFGESRHRKPNIVVIMTDDAGYSDLGCYGGEFPTPNIDSLATGGMRYQRFYNFARCSPTRACLLTGQHPQVVGVGDLCGDGYATDFPGYIGHLDERFPTIANLLKSAGYHTMITGKWHMGGEHGKQRDRHLRPLARGFDRFFGFLDASTGYFSDSPERHPGEYWIDDRAVGEDELESDQFKFNPQDAFYATDAYTKKALDFIDEMRSQSSDQPFFLYMPYNAPHNPREATEEDIEKYIHLYDNTQKWFEIRDKRYQRLVNSGLIPSEWKVNDFEFSEDYYQHIISKERVHNLARLSAIKTAQLVHVDDNVGRLITHLRQIGELDNTLIFYFSDNGSAVAHDLCNIWSTPFRGAKGQLEQGGMVTHCIVHWPAGLKDQNGIISETSGSVLDLVPTFLNVAGVKYPESFHGHQLPPLEGRNLLPDLNKESANPPEYQYWDLYGHKSVIENDRWKWLSIYNPLAETSEDYLYDLNADGTEMNDLKERYPEKVVELKKCHAAWAQTHNVVPFEVVSRAQLKFIDQKTLPITPARYKTPGYPLNIDENSKTFPVAKWTIDGIDSFSAAKKSTPPTVEYYFPEGWIDNIGTTELSNLTILFQNRRINAYGQYDKAEINHVSILLVSKTGGQRLVGRLRINHDGNWMTATFPLEWTQWKLQPDECHLRLTCSHQARIRFAGLYIDS